MDNRPQTTDDLKEELRNLGANLKEVLRTAWEREERKKAQADVEAGLAELVAALSEISKELTESPAGQRLRAEAKDLQARVQTGEVQEKVHYELLEALRKVNADLRKVSNRWGAAGGGEAAGGQDTTPPDASSQSGQGA
jgi:hypothetical protein